MMKIPVFNEKKKQKLEFAEKHFNDTYNIEAKKSAEKELAKRPFRYDIINFLVKQLNREVTYLEIGVRVPAHNFDKIEAAVKYSVDPGVEREHNPVDFAVTSDEFFRQLEAGEILTRDTKFDIIFIDGLHLANQVEKDIENALKHLSDDGFIVMHDCNPPTEFHARENFSYILSPVGGQWNGTTWKAFFKTRKRKDIFSCCVDTDWGVGILSKNINFGSSSEVSNDYFEYEILNANRKSSLNLVSFDDFCGFFKK